MRFHSNATRVSITLTVLVGGLLLAACAASPLPAPTPAPPAEPATPAGELSKPIVPTPTGLPTPDPTSTSGPASDLVRTKVKGVLRVGTTLDNPPFSTVNDKLQPDGFDIALITELARRLGLGVEINDFTFDHLGPAVVKNQVDAAIAAISITPDRAGQVDFTNVYYVGQDGVLAAPDSAITRVGSLNDLAQLRVGVQKGSVYERWMNENAVQTGKMPAERLIPVVSPDSGLDALADGQIDALLLDRQPARTFAQQGKAKLVGEQLYPQVYGIAVSKGSSLLPELNRVLAEAQADGTVKRLVEEYLDVRPEAVLPATSVPFGDASGTPRAAPTP